MTDKLAPSLETLTPISISSPWIIGAAVFLAIFSHFFQLLIPTIKSIFLTTSANRAKFSELYTEYRSLLEQTKNNTNNSADFVQNSLLQRKIIQFEIQLEKYPPIYFESYALSRGLPVSECPVIKRGGNLGDEQPDGLASSRIGNPMEAIWGKLISFVPTCMVFLTYLFILFTQGWNYELFSLKDFSGVENDVFNIGDQFDGVFMGLFGIIFSFFSTLFWIIPGGVLYTIKSTTTSFFGLYWLVGRTLNDFFPQKQPKGLLGL
jgi:hypothetical protein